MNTVHYFSEYSFEPPTTRISGGFLCDKKGREMLKRILILLIMVVPLQTFATDVTGGETCDTNVLNTDTGPVNLRAEFEPENINLHWYNGDNQITVPTASNSCTYDTPISLPTDPVKPGYKFKGWKILTKYIPIQYIESTGTQYIDTEIFVNSPIGLGVETRVEFTQFDVERAICGMAANGGAFELGTSSTGQLFLWNTPGYEIDYPSDMNLNTVYDISGSMTDSDIILTVNGTIYRSGKSAIQNANSNLIIFGHWLSNGGYPAKLKMYYFKVYQNGVLVRNFIPVKDLNGVVCMYDHISGQFFYNSGTGDFIAGPEI